MPKGAPLVDARIMVDGFNLSGHQNQLQLSTPLELQDVTCFADGAANPTKANAPGLEALQLSGSGYWESDPLDTRLFVQRGLVGMVAAIGHKSGAGEIAYICNVIQGDYNFLGAVGEANPFDIDLQGAGGETLRGKCTEDGNVSATGAGVAVQMVAVTATQNLVVQSHVHAFAGTTPTLDGKIESATDQPFTSPNDRGDLIQATGLTVERKVIAGPITPDTWFRMNWTIGGTASPNFNVYTVFAIENQ